MGQGTRGATVGEQVTVAMVLDGEEVGNSAVTEWVNAFADAADCTGA